MSENIQRKIDEIKKIHNNPAGGPPRRPSRRPVIPPQLAGKLLNKPFVIRQLNQKKENEQVIDIANEENKPKPSPVIEPPPRRFDTPPRPRVRKSSNSPTSTLTSVPSESKNNSLKIVEVSQCEGEECKRKIHQLEEKLEKQNSSLKSIENLHDELEKAHEEISRLESKLASSVDFHDKQKHELESSVKSLTEESAVSGQRIKELEIQLENAFLKSTESDLQRIKELEIQIQKMQTTFVPLTEVDQLKEDYESELSLMGEKLNAVTSEVMVLKKQNAQLTDETADYEKVVGERDSVKAAFELEKKTRQENEGYILEMENRLDECEKALKKSEKIVEAQNCEIEELKVQIESMDGKSVSTTKELEEALDTANQNIEELLVIYDAIQAENESLKEKLDAISRNGVAEKSCTVFDAEREEYELEIKRWEDYCREIESDRDSLKRELEIIRTTASRHSAQFISDDQQLLGFIEAMSSKTEEYQKQIRNLKQRNEELEKDLMERPKIDTQTKTLYSADSAYASSITSSASSGEQMTKREKAMLEDLDKLTTSEENLQKEVNSLHRELDRLSLAMSNTDSEKHRLNATITSLRDEITKLQEKLHDEISKNLGSIEKKDEPLSVANMRREFRKAIEEIRNEFRELAQKELESRLEAERELRAYKRERDLEAYSKTTQACQTLASMVL